MPAIPVHMKGCPTVTILIWVPEMSMCYCRRNSYKIAVSVNFNSLTQRNWGPLMLSLNYSAFSNFFLILKSCSIIAGWTHFLQQYWNVYMNLWDVLFESSRLYGFRSDCSLILAQKKLTSLSQECALYPVMQQHMKLLWYEFEDYVHNSLSDIIKKCHFTVLGIIIWRIFWVKQNSLGYINALSKSDTLYSSYSTTVVTNPCIIYEQEILVGIRIWRLGLNQHCKSVLANFKFLRFEIAIRMRYFGVL